MRVVVVALQRVCIVAGQAAWGSWVGVHCHILLTCTDRHQQLGDAAGDPVISEYNVMLHTFLSLSAIWRGI